MLEVHHLERSQSERIILLCEELAIPYTLHTYPRDPTTALAPPAFKALHPAGTAPVITDGPSITIAESGACIEYICRVHGGSRLLVEPTAPGYADFLQMFHWANATLQAASSRFMFMSLALGDEGMESSPFGKAVRGRYEGMLAFLDERLGRMDWLAGDEFTAADVMAVYTLTSGRGFTGGSLTGRENILRYLQRLAARPAYKRAREKGDPTTPPYLGAVVEMYTYPGLTGSKSTLR